MVDDAKLARVRKLLAMAEAESLTDEARASYNAKAAELIAEYGIDEALLDAGRPGVRRAADRLLDLDPPYALDKLGLLRSVAQPLGCRVVHIERRGAGSRTHAGHLFGMTSDIDRTLLLYTSLLVQASFGLATAAPARGEDVRAFRRSWLAGFAGAVFMRLLAAEEKARGRAERTQAAAAGPGARSVALVLADRASLVDGLVDETYPRLVHGRRRSLSGSGHAHGYEAGQRADLGGTRVSPGGGSRSIEGR